MSTIKIASIIFILSQLLLACNGCESKNDQNKITNKEIYKIEHFNINIVPDLSNRILSNKSPKPVEDTKIVEEIIEDIYPNILKNSVEFNQPDKVQMVFTNPKIISYYNINNSALKFDFHNFKDQNERITYLLDRDKKGEFKNDKDNFKKEFTSIIEKARKRTCGADIWSFFNNELNERFIITKKDTIKDRNNCFIKQYKNIVVLITDGYIEAGLYGKETGNKTHHLSSKDIRKFRIAYEKSNETDIKEFFTKNGYGIIPAKNPLLSKVEVMAIEFYDRSLTKSGNATVHPTDGEIIKIFWEDWMKKSGVKRFKSYKITNTPDEFLSEFHSFAGIKVRNN